MYKRITKLLLSSIAGAALMASAVTSHAGENWSMAT